MLSEAALESSREEQRTYLARAGRAWENFDVAGKRPPWRVLLGTGRREVEAIAVISLSLSASLTKKLPVGY